VNWAKLITCKTADLTREGQPRGNGISGDDGLAVMGGSRKLFAGGLLKRSMACGRFMSWAGAEGTETRSTSAPPSATTNRAT